LELTFTGRKKIQQMPSQKHFRIVFVSDVFSFRRHFAMTENAGFSCSRAKVFFDQHRMPLIDWQKFSGIFRKASPRKSYPSGTKLKANKSM
jgi:maltooligosyltrehalose synthase